MKLPATALMIGAAFALGSLAMLAFLHTFKTGDNLTVAVADAPAALYWYDPMYPDRHFEQPGKSPFMDMQLVPKYAGSSSVDSGVVPIDSRIAQNLGMRTGIAERGRLRSEVRATASVAFDDRSTSVLQAKVNGIVEQLLVRSPMASVQRGETLMILIAPEWTAAQEEYLSLRRMPNAKLSDVLDAARRRLGLLGMSEGQIQAIERSDKAQTHIAITAPRAGVVSELSVRDGESVLAGAPLARINGIDTVWVHAAISEAQIGNVSVGASAEISLPAFPGQTFSGTVDALLPTLDASSRTQTARIVLANPQHRLTPGMSGAARIHLLEGADVVLIPSEAVIATGTRQVVIVAAAAGAFRAQEVRIGNEAEGRSEVLGGIAEGERVVLSGQFLIDSEASLVGTLARLSDSSDSPASEPTSASNAERHPAHGTLLAIDGRDWRVDTGPVPSLQMGAMRMQFVGPARALDSTIAAGQQIKFVFFRNQDGDFEIDPDSIRLVKPSAGVRP